MYLVKLTKVTNGGQDKYIWLPGTVSNEEWQQKIAAFEKRYQKGKVAQEG